jgi:hypothetical protein
VQNVTKPFKKHENALFEKTQTWYLIFFPMLYSVINMIYYDSMLKVKTIVYFSVKNKYKKQFLHQNDLEIVRS